MKRAVGAQSLVLASLVFVGVALAAVRAEAVSPTPATQAAQRIHDRLSGWEISGVEQEIAELRAAYPDAPVVPIAEGRLHLMRREFEDALRVLTPVCESDTRPAGVERLCAVAAGSLEVTRDFKTTLSDGGHFVIHYQPGPDEVLVPYASETLEAAYERLGELFRYRPEEPVHVDFVPTVEALAKMTPLTEEEIHGSGTIAMCKYARMMVVSPRDLVYGYGWRDTLSHEYIHFVLTASSGNRVPLWLHEGLAKHFEGEWRAGNEPRLAAFAEDLLADALRRNRLVSFDKMYPSFGKLETQEEASLAFAQVFTLIRYMVERQGEGGLQRLLDGLAQGRDEGEALREVYGVSFRRLLGQWKRWVKRQPLKRLEKKVTPKKLFRGRDRKEDEIASIKEERGRDLTYLGDLLRARGRHLAALREYEKANVVVGQGNPVLQSKKAAAEMALGRADAVLGTVGSVLQIHPEHVLLQLYQGEALLRLGRAQEAIPPLVEAIGLNPFDARVHELLAEAYEATGDRERAAFERRQQALVAQD